MNFRQLNHVVALAQHQNFHRAANAVGLSQSALTQSIRSLETTYGVELFDRSKRAIVPTAFGLAVIQFARRTLAQMSNLQRELSLMQNLQSARMIIGCDAWSGVPLLSPALGQMLKRFPELRFSVRVGSIEAMQDTLLDGGIDLFVGTPPEAHDARLQWHDISLPSKVFVCNPHHPLLALEAPTPTDCLAYPIISPTLPKWYLDWVNTKIHGVSLPDGRDIFSYVVEIDDLGVIRELVRTTNAISSIPRQVVLDDLERGRLQTFVVPELEFPQPVAILHATTSPLSIAGEILLKELKEQALILQSGLTA